MTDAASVETPQESAPAADWRQGLPEPLRAHPALARVRDVGDLADQFVNAQALIGRKGLIAPSDRDPPELWDRFYAALGRPERPDGYVLELPDGVPEDAYDQELAREFRERAHALGLSGRQAEALHRWFGERAAAAFAARAGASAADAEGVEATLRREWGEGYGEHIAAARRAAQRYLDADGLQALGPALSGEAGAAVVRLLARVGAALGEDSLVGNGGGEHGLSADDAEAEIGKVMGDAAHAYWNRLDPRHRAAVQRMESLFAIKAG